MDEVSLEIEKAALVLVQPGPDADTGTKLPREWVKFHVDQEFYTNESVHCPTGSAAAQACVADGALAAGASGQ